MHCIYQGSDNYEVHFDCGQVVHLSSSQIEELAEDCESYQEIDNELYDVKEMNKEMKISIQESLEYITQLTEPISNIRRTKVREEIEDLLESISDTISQYI